MEAGATISFPRGGGIVVNPLAAVPLEKITPLCLSAGRFETLYCSRIQIISHATPPLLNHQEIQEDFDGRLHVRILPPILAIIG